MREKLIPYSLFVFRCLSCRYEKYPSVSPYAYCVNNSVMYVDLDGREVFVAAISENNNDLSSINRHGGRSNGIIDGHNDKNTGRINRLHPIESFKDNKPLIILHNNKKKINAVGKGDKKIEDFNKKR